MSLARPAILGQHSVMNYTRRDATKLILSTTALAATPLAAGAASNQEWGQKLQADLNAALASGYDGRFAVTGFGHGRNSTGRMVFLSEVELHWPPGRRRRLYRVEAGTEAAAYEAMVEEVKSATREVWRGSMG